VNELKYFGLINLLKDNAGNLPGIVFFSSGYRDVLFMILDVFYKEDCAKSIYDSWFLNH